LPEVFQSSLPSSGKDEGVVVVHCSDPRYQPHFQEFLRRGLGLERYGLVAIPGGVQTLTLVDYLPKFAWSGWRWMKFMMQLTKPSRIVLLTHEDCRWYLDNRFVDADRARERQLSDLRKVRSAMQERFGEVRVELYYAVLQGQVARFESM
jgi:hypothetical protein